MHMLSRSRVCRLLFSICKDFYGLLSVFSGGREPLQSVCYMFLQFVYLHSMTFIFTDSLFMRGTIHKEKKISCAYFKVFILSFT